MKAREKKPHDLARHADFVALDSFILHRETLLMSTIHLFLLAIVEGLTEFLPISSTGHLIVVSALLGISEDEFVKSFNIIIQSGAIFSVLVLYWRRFFPIRLEFYKKIIVAFLPAAIIGLAVKSKIDLVLGSVQVVAWTLVLGGIVLIWADRKFKSQQGTGKTIADLSYANALAIGFIQCLAFLPGVSRAAATILGGMWMGLSKKEAAEFSFFLAVPTLTGASLIKTLGVIKHIQPGQWGDLALGLFIAFVVAIFAIRSFLGLVQRFGFDVFGWYRIVLGAILFTMIFQGMLS